MGQTQTENQKMRLVDQPKDPAALRKAAKAAEAAGDKEHAVALRKAALFSERRIREIEAGCGEVAIWMDA